MEVRENAYMTTQGKNKAEVKYKGKDIMSIQSRIKKESKFFFCKNGRH